MKHLHFWDIFLNYPDMTLKLRTSICFLQSHIFMTVNHENVCPLLWLVEIFEEGQNLHHNSYKSTIVGKLKMLYIERSKNSLWKRAYVLRSSDILLRPQKLCQIFVAFSENLNFKCKCNFTDSAATLCYCPATNFFNVCLAGGWKQNI